MPKVKKQELSFYIKKFYEYILLEKNFSNKTVEAYIHDIKELEDFLKDKNVETATSEDIQLFLIFLSKKDISVRSQARILSGIKSFYCYLLYEGVVSDDPTRLIDTPKIGRHLPEVLSIPEIDAIFQAIDLSEPEGHRNKAILEVLYGCGLRVSELVNLQLSQLRFHEDEQYLRVVGKGDKERLVPISKAAQKAIELYLETRNSLPIKKEAENIVFLNKRGNKLSREMIFIIVKKLTQLAGIKKNVSPHTFRHSFATHLVKAGADLRAVQEMLGHESITTTEIYTHLDRKYLRSTFVRFHPRFE
ncbi:MAG TPA: site-specific tyrosine recombinase XerD [Bacteroidales bacterium]|nr:site-specific tyrosine recombinase XerD [Bacteroidales bacterium]HQA85971.1 site-specific tyrosine recombinase XerD [Bacteroidales bacterium]